MDSGSTATPVDEVDSLISQVAEEAGLDLMESFPEMANAAPAQAAGAPAAAAESQVRLSLPRSRSHSLSHAVCAHARACAVLLPPRSRWSLS